MSTKNVHHIAGAVRGWNLNLMLSQIDNNKNERFWFNISNIRYENVVVASENFTFSNFFPTTVKLFSIPTLAARICA